MKYKLSITCLTLIFASFFFGCRGPVKKENATNTSPGAISILSGNEQYVTIDPKESLVTWKGSMLFGANSHSGYVYISKGELMMENGQLKGGSAEIDMNTMGEQEYGTGSGLVKHLKSPDFFDTQKFPFSTIAITRVEFVNAQESVITGNLTIKGLTHQVSFPAKIEVKDGTVRADGKLVIDRTKWDVRYKSGKFFDNLKDETISDEIEFDIKIVAKK